MRICCADVRRNKLGKKIERTDEWMKEKKRRKERERERQKREGLNKNSARE
jgi:hypothetical protein